MEQEVDVILRRIRCYRNVARVRADAMSCIAQVRSLIPKIERLIHNNGMESELLVLAGTVPILHKGRQYNIPVEIYISEPYPDAPPRCYVRPTRDMEISPGHKHVDREGLVYLPYLHEWQARGHNLTDLCSAMSSVFSATPPVHAIRTPQPQPPVGVGQAQPSPTGWSGSGGGQSASMMQYPGQRPVSGQQPPPPPQHQPPPSYDAVAAGGGYAGYGGGGGAQPQAQSAEARRREAAQQVLSKTQRNLQDFYAKVRAELTEERDREAQLQERRKQVAGSIQQLKKMKETLEGRIKEYTEKDVQLDAWAAEQGQKPEVHVDDMVEALDPPSRQMLELVATNAAIEDALYHMDKALANSALDLPTFLKKVRDLSREQFFAVAHVNKIYRTQQAAIVAARGAAQQQQLQQQQHQQLYQQQAPPGQFAGPISYPVLPGQRK